MSSVNTAEKARTLAHCASLNPAALQPDAIMETVTTASTDANVTTSPQSVNKPITMSEPVGFTNIDGSGSSTNWEVTPTVTSGDKKMLRSFRRSLRAVPSSTPSFSVTGTQNATKASRPSELDEQNRKNSNLFIRNLDTEVDQAELDRLFGEYGTILSSAVMRNIHTGESLGTAFVRMSTHEEARAAMDALHNHPIKSKAILIQWAKRHDGAPVGEARKKIMKLFVRNIPLDCSVEMLEALFGQYGNVRQVTLHKDTAPVEDPAMVRLIAFVIYTEEGAAERAATAVHNTKPFPSCHDIPIMIKLAEDQVRHERPRLQRYSHPISPQQQQQSQRRFNDTADESDEVTALFSSTLRSPKPASNSSEYSSSNNNSRGGGVFGCVNGGPSASMGPFDFSPYHHTPPTATYVPPSALLPGHNNNTFAPQPLLGTPTTSPLAMKMAVPLDITATTSLHNNRNGSVSVVSAGGSLMDSRLQRRSVMDPAYPSYNNSSRLMIRIPTPTGSNSMQSSPENSLDGSGGVRAARVPIPNPRSVVLAAANQKRVGETARMGCTLSITRPVLSPCLSADSGSVPVSPAIPSDMRSLEGVRSLLKYRHNPYSMSSSLFVC